MFGGGLVVGFSNISILRCFIGSTFFHKMLPVWIHDSQALPKSYQHYNVIQKEKKKKGGKKTRSI